MLLALGNGVGTAVLYWSELAAFDPTRGMTAGPGFSIALADARSCLGDAPIQTAPRLREGAVLRVVELSTFLV